MMCWTPYATKKVSKQLHNLNSRAYSVSDLYLDQMALRLGLGLDLDLDLDLNTYTHIPLHAICAVQHFKHHLSNVKTYELKIPQHFNST